MNRHTILLENNPDEVVAPINNYFNDDIYLFEGRIILNSKSFCDSGFVAVDTSLDSFEQVVLINKLKPWRDDRPELVKLFDYGNRKIFRIKYCNLYTTDSSFSRFNYFYKDTLFMYFDTTYEFYKQWSSKFGIPDFYFTVGNTLFIGKWKDSTKYDIIYNQDGSRYYIPY